MADSENSRTMPAIARRKIRAAAAAYVGAASTVNAREGASEPRSADESGDPTFRLWCDWMEAHERLLELGERQQQLETQLFSMVGTPLLSPAAWEAADQQIGYGAAKQAEDKASEIDDEMANVLWHTPAHSVAGVTAKLHAMLEKGAPSKQSREFPWPQIRCFVIDLVRIDGGACST